MSNIEANDNGASIDVSINDPALIRRYEKACGCLDEKKIIKHIDDFLSRN